ncbi:MAG: hypothetical protein H0X12_18195 [Nocardioides sp.]|nr:hypothetical protein [Nocardioides sp.]
MIEKALGQQVATGPTHADTGPAGQGPEGGPVRRTITALGNLYLQRLARLDRDEDYIANRRGLLTKHVYPVIGDLLVKDWPASTPRRSNAGFRRRKRPSTVPGTR